MKDEEGKGKSLYFHPSSFIFHPCGKDRRMIVWPNFYLAPLEKLHPVYRGWKELREWGQTILFVVVFYFACTTVLVEAYQIPSGSMEPTLHGDPSLWKGDRVVATKWISKLWPIQRGDIVVFISVEDHKTFIVKRVVGLQGDTIEVKPPHVYVNGKPLVDPPSFQERSYTIPHRPFYRDKSLHYTLYGVDSPFVVPKDSYFMMGDNSSNSNDSRFWGYLPASGILGKVVLIFWPPQNARVIH
jgi:signal peptidase I